MLKEYLSMWLKIITHMRHSYIEYIITTFHSLLKVWWKIYETENETKNWRSSIEDCIDISIWQLEDYLKRAKKD